MLALLWISIITIMTGLGFISVGTGKAKSTCETSNFTYIYIGIAIVFIGIIMLAMYIVTQHGGSKEQPTTFVPMGERRIAPIVRSAV